MAASATPSCQCGNSPPVTAASCPSWTCEDELLTIADRPWTIAYFVEATRAVVKGPYDLSLVEGSEHPGPLTRGDQQVRQASKVLVTIGTCATSGGIQALRNFAGCHRLPPPGLSRAPASSRP